MISEYSLCLLYRGSLLNKIYTRIVSRDLNCFHIEKKNQLLLWLSRLRSRDCRWESYHITRMMLWFRKEREHIFQCLALFSSFTETMKHSSILRPQFLLYERGNGAHYKRTITVHCHYYCCWLRDRCKKIYQSKL